MEYCEFASIVCHKNRCMHEMQGYCTGMIIITARRSYANAVLGVVILSICPSICHVCFVTNPKNLPAIFLYHMKGHSF